MNPAGRVQAAFGAAGDYDVHARVQRHAADRLADRIASLTLPARPRILEIGCGTGFLTEALVHRIGDADWLVTDVAPEMIERCRGRVGERPNMRFAQLDGERPDAIEGEFDLICSSFTFQWFADLAPAIGRLGERLRRGGRIVFTMPAAGSLGEWHAAHRHATGRTAAMADYPAPDALTAMAPCLDGVVETEQLRESYPHARAFLASLRAIGAHRPRDAHAPLSGGALRRAMATFEASGATVSWNVAYVVLTRAAEARCARAA